MYPTITLFGRTLGTYGICAALGVLALLGCVALLARRRGMSPDDEVICALVSLIGVALGASALYGLTNAGAIGDVLTNASSYSGLGALLADLARCFDGFVFYGGLIGGLAVGSIYAHARGWDVLAHLDIFAVAIPLFHVFGRIGCFFGGCCYGVEVPWGITYTMDPIAQANGVPRVPIQLIEAACNLVIFATLLALFLRGHMGRRLIGVYGLLYGCVRFVDEFWRGDAYRGFLGPFSTSQWISLLVIVASVILLVAMHRKQNAKAFATRD
ncbi:MAG: prolipoprotein diacylglyceryl transferase [Coriobacteriia bacterium]|nr:prolipoprotein diacylglyceryl transferase [Coriobacteriia bacterium]MBS5477457.1 prolipoprotein diacylglyceryl transferase [Coriobacteriia bacterium]